MPASVVWIGLGCVLVMYLFSFGWNPGPVWVPDRSGGLAGPCPAGSLVGGVEREECQPGRDAGAQLDEQVDPDRRPGEQAGGGAAHGHGPVGNAPGGAP